MEGLQRTLWILIVVVAAIGLIGLLWWLASHLRPTAAPTNTTQTSGSSGGLYPVTVGITSTGTATSSAQATLPTIDIKGNNVTVRTLDFTKDPSVQTDSAHANMYALAGGLHPSAQTTPYSIVYYSDSQTFVVTILQEPIGSNRLAAEQALQKELGIDQSAMCQLNYFLGAPESVSERYAGINLGFSYCPGATQLPN